MSDAPVSVLHLEDDLRDARLIKSQLALEGLECAVTRVDREAAYQEALAAGGFDIILADHSLPDFDLLSALTLARQVCPDVPFVCVSGSLGEELAIETLKNGATDYVLKQRLARLGPAVRRALAERDERRRRRAAEDAVAEIGGQLRHAQKLEAVGQLAGGIAHDFNNLLTVITGHCERLLGAVDAGSPARADVELIHQSCQRASGLTRQLLAFGRRQVIAPRPVDLNEVVRSIARILERVLGERTSVMLALDPALGAIRADPGQIEQVLMNLAINARDAMPDGGTITIATANLHDGAERAFGLPPGPYLQLTVRDTGLGMDETTRARAFEPFFTTKAAGYGTGLGLSTVYGIVVQSGGHVAVDSQPGQGTTMRVVLPRVESVTPTTTVGTPLTVPAAGHETVLLVEDEAFVRDLVRGFLQTAGYRVLEAGSAEEALEQVAAGAPHVDLLITDVVLPGQNGPWLAETLRRQLPHMDTLYMSGYPGDSMFGDDAFEPGAAFLPKPFSRHVLERKVREVLDARTGASAPA